jgi:hypothetical protein
MCGEYSYTLSPVLFKSKTKALTLEQVKKAPSTQLLDAIAHQNNYLSTMVFGLLIFHFDDFKFSGTTWHLDGNTNAFFFTY